MTICPQATKGSGHTRARRHRRKRAWRLAASCRSIRAMKAMVFAAGIGSRLKELTLDTPKCLIQVGGKPMLEHVIDRLRAVGVTEIAINLHHFPEKITRFVEGRGNFNLKITFSHEPSLLDTGGGLKKLRGIFEKEDAFIIHNSDVYCETDLSTLVALHRKTHALATLAVMKRASKRGLYFDNSMKLVGWTEEKNMEAPGGDLFAFGGISVCSGEIFSHMDARDAFSIIEPFLRAARSSQRVYGSEISPDTWIDIGTPEQLARLQRRLRQQ